MSIKSTLAKALLGSIPGMAIAGVGIGQLAKSYEKSMEAMKEDLVDASEIVARHAPDVTLVTSKSDIGKITKSDIEKKILSSVLERLKSRGNAAYVSGLNAILSPKMINRSLIGHEIGHSVDNNKRGVKTLDAILSSNIEGRAWKASPFRDKKSRETAEKMLGTYRGWDKITVGAPAAVSGAFALPLILKALKRK